MDKILVIVGPTASGKSELAVKLAKKYNGEILSADSRQIYRGLDLGTGKVAGKRRGKVYLYKGVPHYGIDIASPRSQYSAAQFQKYARGVIKAVLKREKLPIICGGTAHWVDAVVYDQKFPEVKPDLAIRKKLEKLSVEDLFKRLKKLDPERAQSIDAKNPRRLVRALEIVMATGKTIPKLEQSAIYDATWLGIRVERETLKEKIRKRLQQRLRQGMLKEIEGLHRKGLPWKRMWELGLEYRWGSEYLQQKLSKQEMLDKLESEINKYAKRQMTWWKRNKKIEWL